MNLPPKGPKVPWPFGVSPMNRTDPLGLLEGWARQFGDIFRWRTLYFFVVFVNHPDLVEKVLVSESRNYMKGRGLQANRELFGNGLLTSEGDSWLRQRRLMQPAFHRERIAAYAGTMIEQGRLLAESWRDGETRDVHADLMRRHHSCRHEHLRCRSHAHRHGAEHTVQREFVAAAIISAVARAAHARESQLHALRAPTR
jgi:cytochrome P450